MMYDEVGLESMDSAASDEFKPAAGPSEDAWAPRSIDFTLMTSLDERLVRIIRNLDR